MYIFFPFFFVWLDFWFCNMKFMTWTLIFIFSHNNLAKIKRKMFEKMWGLRKSLEKQLAEPSVQYKNLLYLMYKKIEKRVENIIGKINFHARTFCFKSNQSDYFMPSSSNEVIQLFEVAASIVILISSCCRCCLDVCWSGNQFFSLDWWLSRFSFTQFVSSVSKAPAEHHVNGTSQLLLSTPEKPFREELLNRPCEDLSWKPELRGSSLTTFLCCFGRKTYSTIKSQVKMSWRVRTRVYSREDAQTDTQSSFLRRIAATSTN